MYVCICVCPSGSSAGWAGGWGSKSQPEPEPELKLLCINFRSLFAFDNCMGNISTTILQIAFVCQGERMRGREGGKEACHGNEIITHIYSMQLV